VFGIVPGEEAPLLRSVARALQARGTLVTNEHGGFMLGGDARALLKGEGRLDLVVAPKAERTSRRRGGTEAVPNPVGDPLFEALRALRRELAQEAGVPPYVIFHDSVLRDMATRRPASLQDLGQIGGVGARKLEAYGEDFLSVIAQF
jgi:ATP-dependent DNA helicase RecQ